MTMKLKATLVIWDEETRGVVFESPIEMGYQVRDDSYSIETAPISMNLPKVISMSTPPAMRRNYWRV